MLLVMEVLKRHLLGGGSNEPSVPRARLDNLINGTSRLLFGEESDCRKGSTTSKGCIQRKQKWWTAERKNQ
jgi:hypothetical protein